MVEVLKSPGFYAHRFVAINRSNYTAGREGNKPKYVVVHIMQGSYEGSISWAQNGASNVSWHYAVSESGHTTQQLSENHTAWTNSNWYINQRGISLEHEGYHPRAASAVPKAQLHASAKLVAGICLRHGIPIDRDHIFGHTEIQGVAKPCPSGWPWGEYIRLVKRYAGGKSPSEPVKPVPDTRIKWVNYVYDSKSAWGAKIAAAMYAALTAVGVRGGLTEKAAKAAADAREQAGVYTFLIGSDAVRRAKRYQKEFTDLDISYNISGAVRVVTPSFRDRAKWRIADFCEELKLDEGAAIQAFESAMGKTDDEEGGEKMPEDGSTWKGHRWQGWQPPKEPKASGSYIERAPTRWHTHWDERVADLAKQIEQKWPGVSCLTYIPGHPLEDWAIKNGQHSVSFDVWDKRGRGYPLNATTHEEVFDYVFNRQSIPIRYVIKRSGGTAYDWMWVRGTGWEKYYSGYTHSNHPHFTMALGPRANF